MYPTTPPPQAATRPDAARGGRRIQVRMSGVHGKGVYAIRPIPASETSIEFYAGNRGHTYLGNPDDRAQIYPDYVRVCNSFNVKCERVMYKKDLRPAIQRMLDANEPYVLDVIVPYTEHGLPFIPANRTVADMIWRA